MAVVKIQSGDRTKVYRIFKPLTTIGSDKANDIVIPDPMVDEVHAHILKKGEDLVIQTTDSGNEMHVNGRRKQRHKLKYGDRIRIGEVTLFFLEKDIPEEEKEKKRGRGPDYRKLVEVSEAILRESDLSRVLEAIMDGVIEITGAEKGFLILAHEEDTSIVVARNLNREDISQAMYEVSDSIVSKVLNTRQALLVFDALSNPEFSMAKSVMDLKLSSVMCVPLLDRGTLLGLIYVGNSRLDALFLQESFELIKVFASIASLVIRNALLMDELKVGRKKLAEELESLKFGDLVGSCDSMQEVYRTVQKIAPTDVSVLITGETGTGKELIAREIHRRSTRADGPFVVINAGAIPENLLESEFFGHEKGSFTGAVSTVPGKFQQAHGGTLFLDEIGDMPLQLQVKILRAIQEREVIKVGGTMPEHVDIRIIAATNRNLEDMVREGSFREDLYYRLNVVNIHLPPLRERDEDVVLLAKYFLKKFQTEFGSQVRGFDKDALNAIRHYPWPGNIRELENRIKRAVVLAETSYITRSDIDLPSDAQAAIKPLSEAREDFTRQYINKVLQMNGGNRTKTARDLGVDPRTIFRYLEKDRD